MTAKVFVKFGLMLAGVLFLSGLWRWLSGGTWIAGSETLSSFATLSLLVGQTALQFLLGGAAGLLIREICARLIARNPVEATNWEKAYDKHAMRRSFASFIGIGRDGKKVA